MASICAAPHCGKETESALKCPVCLKEGVSSVFCNQICFRSSWAIHKGIHKAEDGSEDYNPFPNFEFTGELRPHYPLTPKEPSLNILNYSTMPKMVNPSVKSKTIESGKSLEVLDITASHVKPGITTDELDAILHKECVKRNAYPSPLNYYNFPKSLCTSINEVICHGIPDKTKLQDGDIINLDVTIYYLGFHADLNETYYVGDKAKCNPELVNLVETTRECLDLAIKHVKPGIAFRELGNIIEKHASENNCSVVRTYCGHGCGALFHCQPNIPHYAKNKAIGIAKPGQVFTIEPMLNVGTYKDLSWPDKWTAVTQDGKCSAQFEHMLLVTEDGCEVLSARTETSPGGPVPRIK
ncbi:methionine aminopeptidase, type I [Candida albicans]|uniref:Methionine aminopeptidase n=1 Tax=Candida albicans TaxID=5476 RepID=A0A8H6C490_CANAX|nr:methionine aminopeptidase, type I [Candida albicans]